MSINVVLSFADCLRRELISSRCRVLRRSLFGPCEETTSDAEHMRVETSYPTSDSKYQNLRNNREHLVQPQHQREHLDTHRSQCQDTGPTFTQVISRRALLSVINAPQWMPMQLPTVLMIQPKPMRHKCLFNASYCS